MIATEQLAGLGVKHRELLRKALRGEQLARLALAPWRILETPDPWQKDVMFSISAMGEDNILLCSRQVGKTEAISACGYLRACLGGFVLIITPSDDQSKEFLERLLKHHHRHNLVRTSSDPTKHELRTETGGRILALPNNERTVRVYSAVDMLILDEASRIPDNLYGAVRPMLSVSKGQTILLSTPFGKRGFFYRAWNGQGASSWKRTQVNWRQCSRLSQEFIEEERSEHGEDWVQQEYECKFSDVAGGIFDVAAFEQLVERDEGNEREW